MDRPVNILVLANKICGMEMNVWFVGEGAERLKLGEQRVKMSYGFPRDSVGSILPGKNFDLIIVDYHDSKYEDLTIIKQAQELYPNAKTIFFVSDWVINGPKLFPLAKEYNAQIEYTLAELAEKIRRFFFPEDFKEE